MTSKGLVLVMFLRQLHYRPKLVIMVDDKMINLSNIRDSLKFYDPSTHFVGFQYNRYDEKMVDSSVSADDFYNFWYQYRSYHPFLERQKMPVLQ